MSRGAHPDDWSGFIVISHVVIAAVCIASTIIATIITIMLQAYVLMLGAYGLAAAAAINLWYASAYARKQKQIEEPERKTTKTETE